MSTPARRRLMRDFKRYFFNLDSEAIVAGVGVRWVYITLLAIIIDTISVFGHFYIIGTREHVSYLYRMPSVCVAKSYVMWEYFFRTNFDASYCFAV